MILKEKNVNNCRTGIPLFNSIFKTNNEFILVFKYMSY